MLCDFDTPTRMKKFLTIFENPTQVLLIFLAVRASISKIYVVYGYLVNTVPQTFVYEFFSQNNYGICRILYKNVPHMPTIFGIFAEFRRRKTLRGFSKASIKECKRYFEKVQARQQSEVEKQKYIYEWSFLMLFDKKKNETIFRESKTFEGKSKSDDTVRKDKKKNWDTKALF